MIGRTKHDFPQEAPAAPFKTVLLSELKRALVAKRLYNRVPRDPPRKKARRGWGGDHFVWIRRPRHPLIQQARRWAALHIRNDLQTGRLTAYMPTETAGIFRRIEAQFWHERRSGIRVDGMLFDLDKGHLVPDEIDERKFCAFEKCARSWLARRRIDEDNPAFPEQLRTGGPIKTGPKPTDEQIIAEALRMKKRGYTRDRIAKEIRTRPGFESVTNDTARSLMAGSLPRGRPPKTGMEN